MSIKKIQYQRFGGKILGLGEQRGLFAFVLSGSNLGREEGMESYFCPRVLLENVIA